MAQPAATELLLPGMPRDMLMNQWSIQIRYPTDNPAGKGPSEQLNIHDAATNAPLARLTMPPHCSFGVGAFMTDASGAVVAWLRSASDTRPNGFESSSYRIFSPKPQVPGQQLREPGLRRQERPKLRNSVNSQKAGHGVAPWIEPALDSRAEQMYTTSSGQVLSKRSPNSLA